MSEKEALRYLYKAESKPLMDDKGTKCHPMAKGPQGKKYMTKIEFQRDLLETCKNRLDNLKIDIVKYVVKDVDDYDVLLKMNKLLVYYHDLFNELKVDLQEAKGL